MRDALAGGDLLGAVRMVDEVLLSRALGVTDEAREALVDAHARLTARRVARGAAATAQTTSRR